MDEHDWTSTYPVTTQHLPSMDTPLNFYFHCDTHNVCLDTLASLSHHTFSCSSKQRVTCRWTCGHCALTSATSLAMRRHLTSYSVRLGYAKSAGFATPQMVNLPYFRRKSHLFPSTTLQTMANDTLRTHIVPRYNAMHNHSSHNILRLSFEAANIRKSGHPLPHILHVPPFLLCEQKKHILLSSLVQTLFSHQLCLMKYQLTWGLIIPPHCHPWTPLPLSALLFRHVIVFVRNCPIYRTSVKDLGTPLMSSVLYYKNWHQRHCQS